MANFDPESAGTLAVLPIETIIQITSFGHDLDFYPWSLTSKYFCWILASLAKPIKASPKYCIYLAKNGHLQLLQWAKYQGYYFDKKIFNAAASNGHLDIIKWAYKSNCLFDRKFLLAAAKYGHEHIMKWGIENNLCYGDIDYERVLTKYAARNGMTVILKLFYEKSIGMYHHICACAAECGQFDTLKWLISQGELCCTYTIGCAIGHGHFEMSKWLLKKGYIFGERDTVLVWAAKSGSVELCEWLWSQGFFLNAEIYVTATTHNHLEILQWALNRNCPWNNAVFRYAAENGRFEILKWAIENSPLIEGAVYNQSDVLKCAAKSGNFIMFQWLLDRGFKSNEPHKFNLNICWIYGHHRTISEEQNFIEIYLLCCKLGYSIDKEIYEFIIGYGYVNYLKLLLRDNFPIKIHFREHGPFPKKNKFKIATLLLPYWLKTYPNLDTDKKLSENFYSFVVKYCLMAIKEGRMDIIRKDFHSHLVKMLKSKYFRPRQHFLKTCLCDKAASYGNLEMLRYFREIGCCWGKLTTYKAAKNRHWHVLQWAITQGCSVGTSTCAAIALHGDLSMLEWARQNNCPWSVAALISAARGGHLDVIKWAMDQGCPYTYQVLAAAAKHGHLSILVWAQQNGLHWHSKIAQRAVAGGHMNILQWLLANGCPWTKEIGTTIFRHRRYKFFEWVYLNKKSIRVRQYESTHKYCDHLVHTIYLEKVRKLIGQ